MGRRCGPPTLPTQVAIGYKAPFCHCFLGAITLAMQILNSLVPIFSVIGLGMVLRWTTFLNDQTTQAFNRFAYYFALPLFLFYKLAGATTVDAAGNPILNALLPAVVITALISWLATWIMRVPHATRGTMIQAAFRGNLAFIGLPLVLFVIYDLPDEERMAIESAMLLALTPVILFFNIGSVVALATYSKRTERSFSWLSLVKSIAQNPIVWACFGGAIFQIMQWPLPTAMVRTFEVVGASAFPMALIGIGSQLVAIRVAGTWTRAVIPTLIKCIVCPLIGWGIGSWLGLSGVEMQVVLISCGSPTAVTSFLLAEQMDGDADLAASSVVICTGFSLLTLGILMTLTTPP